MAYFARPAAARTQHRNQDVRRVAIFGIATIVFGLSTNFWLSLAALLVLGASDMVSVFIRSALIQFATPDAMRGRVSAVNMLFIGASNELGEFESGLTAAWFGTVPAGSSAVSARCCRGDLDEAVSAAANSGSPG